VEVGGQHTVEILYGPRIIVSCRNPYTRLVSLWKHKRYQMGLALYKRQGPDQRIKPVTQADYPFESFISQLQYGKNEREPFYYWTQSEWVAHLGRVDHLLRLENLQTDFELAWSSATRRGITLETSRENTSDDATIDRPLFEKQDVMHAVRKWAYQDCLRFGYPVEIPEELLQ
jgi:hypothetical protein